MVDTVLMLSSDTSPRPIPETVSRTLLVSGFGLLTEGRASDPPNAPSGFRSRSEYGLYAVFCADGRGDYLHNLPRWHGNRAVQRWISTLPVHAARTRDQVGTGLMHLERLHDV